MSQEQIARAERARQIAEDPVFIEAWDGLEAGAIHSIATCDTQDVKRLQTLTQALQTVRAVKRRMEAWMAEGKDAAEREARKIEQEQRVPLLSRFRR